MKCRLTGIEGKGVKAHIIPRSFYNLDYSDPIPLRIITNSETGYNGKSFIGIYDPSIVTIEGERIFSPWDDYAYKLLVVDRSKLVEIKGNNGEVIALTLPNYDYTQLKLFFLSVLWRASVSNQSFFQRVALGEHEPILRKAILSQDAGKADFYSVVLSCFTDVARDHTVMMDPFRERYDGINFYRLYIGHYVACIKVDCRIANKTMRDVQLTEGVPLTIIARDFHLSKEKNIIRRVISRNANE